MSPVHSLRGQRTTVRRLALMCAALASAIALLSAVTTVDASAATQPTWVVKFQNNYSKRIFVARATVNEGMCKNFGLMEIRGWLRLEPGETKTGIVTSTPRAHFYARADDGRTWEAPPGPHHYPGPVTDGVFNWCGGRTPPEAYEVRMREMLHARQPEPADAPLDQDDPPDVLGDRVATPEHRDPAGPLGHWARRHPAGC